MRNIAVIDTCIVMDHAAGIDRAKDVLRHCRTRVICALTYVEVMTSIPPSGQKDMETFLTKNFDIQPMDQAAAEHAVYLRQHYRLSIPDAMIYGFARSKSLTLITRNARDFNPVWSGIYVPYEL